MRRRLLLASVLLALTGCIPPISHPRASRTLTVPEPPDVAYGRALKATMALGGVIVQHDPHLHMIQARVQNAVQLNVIITPHGTGSLVEATHQVESTQIVYGDVKLADDFLTAYQQQP